MDNNKMVVIDPINYKKYTFDLNEIRNWIDIKSLKHLLASNPEAKLAFNSLNAKEKESFLLYIENHEEDKCFDIHGWDGINGIDVNIDFILQYNPDTVAFYDKVNNIAKERAFKAKKIQTKSCEGLINIGAMQFPIKTIWGISEDFAKVEDLENEDLLCMFSSYYGDSTNNTTKILLNNKSITAPAHFFSIIGKEEKWIYNIQLCVENNLKLNNLMWHGVPSTKKLYNFFFELGFEVDNKNSKIVEWKRNKTIIQYFKTPKHFYDPFLLIKQVKGKTDVHLRNELGEMLYNKMIETGLLEEIFFYQGQEATNNALSYFETNNKGIVDDLLLEAINSFKRCDNFLAIEANAKIILCEWLKSRVGAIYENSEYINQCNERIIESLCLYRNWTELLEFINNLNNNSNFSPTILQNIFPMDQLEQEFFIANNELEQLKEFWEYYLETTDFDNYEELISKIGMAYSLNLYNITSKLMKYLFKRLKKEDNLSEIAPLFTDEILNISISLGMQKDYIACCSKFIKFFDKYKSQQDFSDLSYAGRKMYRWNSFCAYMGLFKFLYHKAYLLQSLGKNLEEANNCFYDAIEIFQDGNVFIDITENYTEEQFLYIIDNFVILYNMAMLTKNMELVDNTIMFLANFWNKKPSFFLYKNICFLYSTEDRDKMAEEICEIWKEQYGEEFFKEKEIILDLIFLYLSVENWESVIDSLKYALTNYNWSFVEVSKIYSLYKELIQYTDSEKLDVVSKLVEEQINLYKGETLSSQQQIRDTLNLIYSLSGNEYEEN